MDVYGVPVGIRANHAVFLHNIGEYLPHGWQLAGASQVEYMLSLRHTGRRLLLYRNHIRNVHGGQPRLVLQRLTDMIQGYIAVEAPQRIFIGGPVLSWQGGAILLPVRDPAEHIPLVRELVARGAGYHSGTFAVLDSKGQVYPYLEAPWTFRKEADAGFLRVVSGAKDAGPLPVRQVVLAQARRKARWKPQQLSSGQGLLATLAYAPASRDYAARVMTALHRVADQAVFLKGFYSDPGEMAAALLST